MSRPVRRAAFALLAATTAAACSSHELVAPESSGAPARLVLATPLPICGDPTVDRLTVERSATATDGRTATLRWRLRNAGTVAWRGRLEVAVYYTQPKGGEPLEFTRNIVSPLRADTVGGTLDVGESLGYSLDIPYSATTDIGVYARVRPVLDYVNYEPTYGDPQCATGNDTTSLTGATLVQALGIIRPSATSEEAPFLGSDGEWRVAFRWSLSPAYEHMYVGSWERREAYQPNSFYFDPAQTLLTAAVEVRRSILVGTSGMSTLRTGLRCGVAPLLPGAVVTRTFAVSRAPTYSEWAPTTALGYPSMMVTRTFAHSTLCMRTPTR